jgi:hypothetical protein
MYAGNPPPLSIRTDEEDYQILYQCTYDGNPPVRYRSIEEEDYQILYQCMYGNPPPPSSRNYTYVNDRVGGLLDYSAQRNFLGVAVPVILDARRTCRYPYVDSHSSLRKYYQILPVRRVSSITVSKLLAKYNVLQVHLRCLDFFFQNPPVEQ